MTGLNPFDWYGGEFLALYALLFVAAVAGGFAIARSLRPDGRVAQLDDPHELAVLKGKGDRFAEVIATGLFQRRLLALENGKMLVRRVAAGADGLEREVLALPSPVKWGALRRVTDPHAELVEERLVARELLLGKAAAMQIGLFASIPLLLLLGFGYAKYEIGVMRERPVGFLLILMLVTLIAAIWRWLGTDRRTHAGLAALAEARSRHASLQQAAPRDQTGLAVALFGTVVLAGSPLMGLHEWRRSSSDGGGSGGDGSGDGGGGGCGGCGS